MPQQLIHAYITAQSIFDSAEEDRVGRGWRCSRVSLGEERHLDISLANPPLMLILDILQHTKRFEFHILNRPVLGLACEAQQQDQRRDGLAYHADGNQCF